MMRFLVLGAGALGGYFGGRLVEAGQDVTFLVRPARRARLGQTGLVIRSPHGDVEVAAPQLVTATEPAASFDVVLLGCKAYDLDTAMDAIAPAVGEHTAIVPMLNGMRHLEVLSTRFGADRVLGGLCMISAALDEAGRIIHFNDLDQLVYGERDGSRSARVEALEQAFAPARCAARASASIMQEMWEKWIFIAAMAGSTCLLRAAIGDMARAGAGAVAAGMLEEGAAIAAAQGFAPRPRAWQHMRTFLANPDSTLTASMLKDLERGARSEGEHVLGALVEQAPAAGPKPRLLALAAAALRAAEQRRQREAGAA